MKSTIADRVYVVSLGLGTPPWSTISWHDIVAKRRRYFHPIGRSNFPSDPVGWIGFRYKGQLQSVHRVEDTVTVLCRSEFPRYIPEIDGEACRRESDRGERVPHYIYTLGPPEYPSQIVRSGKIYGPGHLWVDRDLLLSCKSIWEAHRLTKERGS
jgi:hypothetical protein